MAENNKEDWQQKTALLIGEEGLEKLRNSHVLIVGLGGVGAYTAEELCRAGVGSLTLVDNDVVETTNRNRQLTGLISNKGKFKTEVLKQRFLDINPEIMIHLRTEYLKDKIDDDILSEQKFDYVVDAIDTLSPKTYLILKCLEYDYPLVSSMGSGGKLDPCKVTISDISKTYDCKLARALRKKLHALGIRRGVNTVFSPEIVPENCVKYEEGINKKSTVGTISYMPAIFGCFCASVVLRDLLSDKNH